MPARKKKGEGEPLTFDKLMETGLGLCGFDPVSFYAMTVPELMAAARGKMELVEMQCRNNWECARFLATAILQPHARKGKRIKPADITTFPWEEKHEISSEELKNQFKKYNAHGTG